MALQYLRHHMKTQYNTAANNNNELDAKSLFLLSHIIQSYSFAHILGGQSARRVDARPHGINHNKEISGNISRNKVFRGGN